MKYNQNSCEELAVYRFTWPGRDEAGACEVHAEVLQNIAQTIGLHLQFIPIDPEAETEETKDGQQ